jgi:hypothetical protein
MLIINEISLMGKIMLTFIDLKLCDIKKKNKKCVGGLNVVMMYR